MSAEKRIIYADRAATAPMTASVRAAMAPYLEEQYGNASAQHRIGRAASRAVFDARARIAAVLGCRPGEIYFTSGGTESDNWAVKGTAIAQGLFSKQSRRRIHMVTTAIEHPAVLRSMRFLEQCGADVTYVSPDEDGIVSAGAVLGAVREDTVLAAVMLANNEIGTIQPVSDIAVALHARGIPLFCDAVQGMGQIPVSVGALGADLLSLSGHKLGAPKGIGILYVRNGIPLAPLLDGGGQEADMRSGTENVAAIVGLAQAMEDAAACPGVDAVRQVQRRLFDRLLNIPGCIANGTRETGKRLCGNVNVSFPGLDAESMVLHLDRAGICCSAGSACHAGKTDPSHVLLAIGRDADAASSSLRFTFGAELTCDDADAIAAAVAAVVSRLRGLGL
ncbi:MAG: cysteine desulfurase [Clostridia bacterium]|nr:cysteine desulfurase [Clostridia bacterium]